MISYGQFATFYDELMSDVPYDKWVAFILSQLQKNNTSQGTYVDLGCGTGSATISLAQHFEQTVGVDLSIEMLTIAQEKATMSNQHIQWIESDMVEMTFAEKSVDCISILCDSLNYVTDIVDVKTTIQNCYSALKPGGLLVFDVHTIEKIMTLFSDFSENYFGENFCYIWNSFVLSEGEVEHELTFFVENEIGLYQRFDELHHQKTFSKDIYQMLLEDIGFEKIDIIDNSTISGDENNMRCFYLCWK